MALPPLNWPRSLLTTRSASNRFLPMVVITPGFLSPMHHQSCGKACIMAGYGHLLLPETIAVWNEHRQSPSDQGRHLTVTFLHHLGMLMCIFEDWLDISKCNGQYCQPFIAFDLAAKNSTNTKTGYILATKKSAKVMFVDTFEEWKVHFTTTFGSTAICSCWYLQEEAFTYEPPPFILPPAHCNMLDLKQTLGNNIHFSKTLIL